MNSILHITETNPEAQPINQNAPAAPGGTERPPIPALHCPSRTAPPPSHDATNYALKRGLDFWELTFAGQHAVLKHEQGMSYVAYLLTHPNAEPLHALDLATRITSAAGAGRGITAITDPSSGGTLLLDREARLQELSLGLEDARAMKANLRRQRELEALVDDEDETDPVREEALRELEALYTFEKRKGARVRGNAQKASDAVGKAIKRLHQRLKAGGRGGAGSPVLREFAEHLHRYLLLPSGRDGLQGGFRRGRLLNGCFVYRPPADVSWGE